MQHGGAQVLGARHGHMLGTADPSTTHSSPMLGPGASGFRGNKETSKCIVLLRILHVGTFYKYIYKNI